MKIAARVGAVLLAAGALVALVWWRGPNWHLVKHSFDAVRWYWVFAAIGLNLLSVVMRAIAWRIVVASMISGRSQARARSLAPMSLPTASVRVQVRPPSVVR